VSRIKTLRRFYPSWWFIGGIRLYQSALSPALRTKCRYLPTCSMYAIEAIQEYGTIRGVSLALQRVGRCHPFREGGYDPVPRTKVDVIGRSN
jgi:putative membrane protein insertion efficiency factor